MTMKKLTTLCLIMATAAFCLTSCNLLEKKPGTPSTVTRMNRIPEHSSSAMAQPKDTVPLLISPGSAGRYHHL